MKYLLIAVALSMPLACNAQFTTQGKIEYERKINVYAQMEDMEDHSWFDKVKSQVPKFNLSYFDLFFNSNQSLYKKGRESDTKVKMWGSGSASENEVLTNFNTHRVIANKAIYEENFIVEDSMPALKWKIMDEIRTIANYKCRKAVSKICDSVYIVAFYTEDIVASGGPEMVSGLPGMILELAVPRLHTTWVATKVDVSLPEKDIFSVSEKGKHVTQQQLYESLKDSFKDWGKQADKNIWWSML